MRLAGKVWNSLESDDRLKLLRACRTALSEGILEHEAALTWSELWPLRQDELVAVDFNGVLGRDVTP